MNLRVDLILDTEQRSASPINLKSIIRILCITIPLIIVVIIGIALAKANQSRNELNTLETTHALTKPKFDEAVAMSSSLKNYDDLLDELESWKNARIEWHKQLREVQKQLPLEMDIQLTELEVIGASKLIDNRYPARVFTLTLEGKGTGGGAENNIGRLMTVLQNGEAFAPLVESLEVKRFDKGARRSDRVFTFTTTYEPRIFK